MSATGVTLGSSTWSFQDNHVERLLDNAAYTSAHPDDTLLLAGKARYSPSDINSMLAIGMVQNFSANQSKMIQPVMAIGSGRQFFVGGKAQTQWNAQRLFVNGRNLLRVLHTSAVQAGIDVSKFDDQAAFDNPNEQCWLNLDSELFLIPFGLALFFRDKIHETIGAFYIECCMISSWGIGLSAGGSMIAEAVSGLADRIVPIDCGTLTLTPKQGYPTPGSLDGLAGSTDVNNGWDVEDIHTP